MTMPQSDEPTRSGADDALDWVEVRDEPEHLEDDVSACTRGFSKRRVIRVFTIVGAALLGFACGVGWSVWPTPFRYEHSTFLGQDCLVRIHRLTGSTSFYWAGRWIDELERSSLGIPADDAAQPSRLPLDQESRIQCRGNLEGSFFEATIYNGSSWRIEEVELELSGEDEIYEIQEALRQIDELERMSGEQPSEPLPRTNMRRFRKTLHLHSIDPQSSGDILIDVGWEQPSWRVVAYYGRERVDRR